MRRILEYAFEEVIDYVDSGAYPRPEHTMPIADAEYDALRREILFHWRR